MKNVTSKSTDILEDDMLPEYDFATMPDGVRGKYAAAYREGHSVVIHHEDGSASVQYFTVEDGAVMLDPDVQKYFPDSASVNAALRCLIPLLEHRRAA